MVNGRLMRRYYYGMQLLLGRGPLICSASSLRPQQQRRMGRAQRNPSLLAQDPPCSRCEGGASAFARRATADKPLIRTTLRRLRVAQFVEFRRRRSASGGGLNREGAARGGGFLQHDDGAHHRIRVAGIFAPALRQQIVRLAGFDREIRGMRHARNRPGPCLIGRSASIGLVVRSCEYLCRES
jgi:hypothetical protein